MFPLFVFVSLFILSSTSTFLPYFCRTQHHHTMFNLNTIETILLGVSVLILLAGITFDSVYIIRATKTKFLITWTTIGVVMMANMYLFAMVGREMWIAGHKKQAKTKFLWKSLKLQRNHVAHRMMMAQGRASNNQSILMQRMRAKRGLLKVEKMNEDIVARDKEVAAHKAELEKMKAMVKQMESDHADGLEEARQKMEEEAARVAEETHDLAERRVRAAQLLAEAKAADDTASLEEEAHNIQKQAAHHKAAHQKKHGLRRAKSQSRLKDRLAARKSMAMIGASPTVMNMKQLSQQSHIQRKLSNNNLNTEQFVGALLLEEDDSPQDEPAGMMAEPTKSDSGMVAPGPGDGAKKDGGNHHHHHHRHKKRVSKKKHSKKKTPAPVNSASSSSSSSSSSSDSEGESFDL